MKKTRARTRRFLHRGSSKKLPFFKFCYEKASCILISANTQYFSKITDVDKFNILLRAFIFTRNRIRFLADVSQSFSEGDPHFFSRINADEVEREKNLNTSSGQVFSPPTRRSRPSLIDYNRFHSVLRADLKEGPSSSAWCTRRPTDITTNARRPGVTGGGGGGILSYRRRGVYHSATPFAPDRD